MRRAIRNKLRFLTIGLGVVVLLLVTRLYFVQVVQGGEYALRAEQQYISAGQTLYDRGTIYFTHKDGTLLSAAKLEVGFTIAMTPRLVKDPEKTYAAINAIVPIAREPFFTSVARTDDPYEVVVRKVIEEDGRAIDALDLPGIRLERERWRAYPGKTRAAQSVGFVAYADDDTLAGRFGLERYYEDTLKRNSTGVFSNFFAQLFANIDNVTKDARQTREGNLITSIEPIAQEKLAQVLAEVNARYGSTETGGIIMDPKTGEIIALDTAPSFDANNFAQGDPTHFGNPLVEHRYEFGSIVKALTMAAGLDSGAVTPFSTYNDTGCTTLNSRTFCNYDLRARGPNTTMQQVLSDSLNMGAAHIALATGKERFRNYFKALGMATETGVDLPSEIRGSLGNIESSPREIEYATASYGQGIAQTPMQMVHALGALANGGLVVTPHLVRKVRLESGIEKQLSWGTPDRVFSAKAVEDTTRMLVEVVDKKLAGGTVKIPEMSVAAKTGTAQIAGPGGKYLESKYFHSFFGYFPAYDPKFIILLYTREPGGVQYASETLTHPFMDLTKFLINYYEIPPDRADTL